MKNKLLGLICVTTLFLAERSYSQLYTSEVEVKTDAGGNVGIGTTAPVGKLSIDGGKLALYWNDNISSFNTVDAHPRISSTGQNGVYPFDMRGRLVLQSRPNDAADIVFATGATPSPTMVVQGMGNVGIGTTSPDKTLTVGNGTGLHTIKLSGNWTGDNSALILENTNGSGSANGNVHIEMNPAGGTTATRHVRLSALEEGVSGGNYAFAVSVSKASAVSEALRINSSGNVGIGTTSPGRLLTLNGNDDSNVRIEINAGGNKKFDAGNSAGNGGFVQVMDPGGVTKAIIRGYAVSGTQAYFTAGNVGIGTTNPSELLQMHGADPVLRISSSNSGAGETSINLTRGYNGTNATRSNWIYFGRNNNTSYKWRTGAMVTSTWFNGSNFRIDQLYSSTWENYFFVKGSGSYRGYIGIGTTSPSYKLDVNGSLRATSITESSDRRLKKNISNLDSETDLLEEISSYKYNLKEDNSFHYGLIAQEIEMIFPHMVSTDEEGYMSVAYREFIPLLIEGYKQQKHDIERQQEEINELKALITQFLNQNTKADE